MDGQEYDVVVVGGGPAGLGGAPTLARPVPVVDGGDPRNAPAEGVHNHLGREDCARAVAAPRAAVPA